MSREFTVSKVSDRESKVLDPDGNTVAVLKGRWAFRQAQQRAQDMNSGYWKGLAEANASHTESQRHRMRGAPA